MNIEKELERLENIIKSEKNTEYYESIKLSEFIFNFLCKIGTNSIILLIQLINLSLIIKNYPKRIIKKGTPSQTGTQFDATIMCLLNYKHVQFSNVEITPILCLPNGEEILQYKLHPSENQNLWTLKNMRWKSKSIGRSPKSRCDINIISFKFSADYLTKLFHDKITKSLHSDTAVIIVHSNQEVDSLLTLFWTDYYRTDYENLINFSCENESTFANLIENLSDFFEKETNRCLTSNNKTYLLDKIQNMFPKSRNITRDEFMKFPMPKLKSSFGQWVMSILKMLKIQTLEKLWVDNCIEGFIAKDVNNVLLKPGSFLLRFSERHAAIGVVLKTENETEPWEPYLDAHLRQCNLANLLCDFSQLTHLRLSNGMLSPRDKVLAQYMAQIPIDEGYTKRGGKESSVNLDSFEFETIEPFDPNNNNYNDFNMESDEYIEMNDNNLDLDEVLRGCDHLLNE